MITFSSKNRNFNIGIFLSQIPYYFREKRSLNCLKKKKKIEINNQTY